MGYPPECINLHQQRGAAAVCRWLEVVNQGGVQTQKGWLWSLLFWRREKLIKSQILLVCVNVDLRLVMWNVYNLVDHWDCHSMALPQYLKWQVKASLSCNAYTLICVDMSKMNIKKNISKTFDQNNTSICNYQIIPIFPFPIKPSVISGTCVLIALFTPDNMACVLMSSRLS